MVCVFGGVTVILINMRQSGSGMVVV